MNNIILSNKHTADKERRREFIEEMKERFSHIPEVVKEMNKELMEEELVPSQTEEEADDVYNEYFSYMNLMQISKIERANKSTTWEKAED